MKTKIISPLIVGFTGGKFYPKKITPHSESILIEKFDFFENHYSKEDKKYMFLHLDNKKDSIKYNGRSYTIDHVSVDSSFSKINDNEIIIFINSKNLD